MQGFLWHFLPIQNVITTLHLLSRLIATYITTVKQYFFIVQSSGPVADQLEYTGPTGFRFLDETMFCFSTLNANTNPNPNCRPGHRPWPLTPWQSLPGRRPWPLTPWQSMPGHRPWPLTRFIAVSSQGRCPGRLCHGVSGQAGFATVLAARVGAQADS